MCPVSYRVTECNLVRIDISVRAWEPNDDENEQDKRNECEDERNDCEGERDELFLRRMKWRIICGENEASDASEQKVNGASEQRVVHQSSECIRQGMRQQEVHAKCGREQSVKWARRFKRYKCGSEMSNVRKVVNTSNIDMGGVHVRQRYLTIGYAHLVPHWLPRRH